MIAGSTRQLVGELFEYRDLGLFEIKEFHDPIPVWRASRGLTPAEAGTTYYERARRAVEEAEEADFAARGTDARLTGRLRVSTGVTFATQHLVPHNSYGIGRAIGQHGPV